MKYALLALFTFALTPFIFAQKQDSLLKVLPSSTDTQRVKVLNDLAMEYMYSEPETSKEYLHEALDLATKLDYNIGHAKALNRLGIAYDVTGDYDSAITSYQHAGVYYAKASNLKGKASTINNIGMLYAATGRYQRALSNYYVALRIFESINEEGHTANCMNNIGIVYSEIKGYQGAVRFFRSAIALYEKTGNTEGLASCYTNIALVFNNLQFQDSCIIYYNKALQIEKENNNYYGLGILYNDIGLIYQSKHETQKALAYLAESLKYKRLLNDKTGEASCLYNIASNYYHRQDWKQHERYLLEAHKIALEITSYRMLKKTSKALYRLYEKKKNFEKALSYISLMNMAEDSVFSEESAKQIAEMQLKYDSEKQLLEIDKKTLELENANLDIGRKRTTIIGLIIGSVLIILIALMLYNRYRHKKQREHDAEMLQQQYLRNRAIIDAEEKERIRIARELHDGIGQQLSAVKMNLSAFDADLKLADEAKQGRMDSLLSLVDEAVKEVRTISHDMMPNALLRSGLVSAVRDFVNKISSTGTLKIDLQVNGLNERLEGTTETVLYRVLQECISNIVKHAAASAVSIQLIKHDTHLNLLIEDNGKGFDTSRINVFEGIGLKNIISRVQYLNGTVEFDSTPGRGTTVIIDIPVG